MIPMMVLYQQQQAQTPGGTEIPSFVQFGALGLLIMCFLLGLVSAKPTVDRIIKALEKAESQRDSLQETLINTSQPALAEAAAAQRESAAALANMASRNQALESRVDHLVEEIHRLREDFRDLTRRDGPT